MNIRNIIYNILLIYMYIYIYMNLGDFPTGQSIYVI